MIHRIVLALAIIALPGCQPSPVNPDFMDIDGNAYHYADMRGKWIIINYWATWCAPCVKEIPELNTLARENTDALYVLGVDFDQPQGLKAKQHARKMKIEFPVYGKDPSSYLGFARPQVLPTTVVISPEGVVQATLVGPQTEKSLLAVVNSPRS